MGQVWAHGENGATLGVKMDRGAIFIAGMSKITAPPVNPPWTFPPEEGLMTQCQNEDAVDFHPPLQVQDFRQAICEGGDLMVMTKKVHTKVEIFTAIYRPELGRKPIRFPLNPERWRAKSDSRLEGKR